MSEEKKKHCIFMVGIKGTGMSSLAVLLKHLGFSVCGCDVAEVFSTDAVLLAHDIEVRIGFSEDLLFEGIDTVIYSSAYHDDLPILVKARVQGCSLYTYPQYVSFLSKQQDSYAVAGTHGKTTCSSVATHLLQDSTDNAFPFYALYGSKEQNVSTIPFYGSSCALFEACEYQDHFLSYQIRGALVPTVDYDHPDYFSSPAKVTESFHRFVDQLTPGGFLIYCADDKGAKELGRYARKTRKDLTVLTYGFSANGPFRIRKTKEGLYTLDLLVDFPFAVQAQAKNLVDDHIGSVVLALSMLLDRPQPKLYCKENTLITDEVLPTSLATLLPSLATFSGCVGRTEKLLEDGGVIFIDDYAHHPKEIETSLEELKLRYPGYSQLVLFSSHTASRTRALQNDFVSSLSKAEHLIIQNTYLSARKDGYEETQDPSYEMYRLLQEKGQDVSYCATDEECIQLCASRLQERWLCITMGAGNNRSLGPQIATFRRSHS